MPPEQQNNESSQSQPNPTVGVTPPGETPPTPQSVNQPPRVPNNMQPYSPAPSLAGTATIALILSGVGLIAWLLPIIGFPVTIIALVLAIRGLKSKKKLAKIALILAVVGLLATVINSAIGAYKGYNGELWFQNKNSQTSTNNDTKSSQRYPESSRTAFINSCVSSGGNQSQCSCILNGIENNLTYEEFADVDRQAAQTGIVPESFRQVQADAQKACQ